MVNCFTISNISQNGLNVIQVPFDTCSPYESVTRINYAKRGVLVVRNSQSVEIEASRVDLDFIAEIRQLGWVRVVESNKPLRPSTINNQLNTKPVIVPGQEFGPAINGQIYFPASNIKVLDFDSQASIRLELQEQPSTGVVEIINKRFSFLASGSETSHEFNVRAIKDVNGFDVVGEYESIAVDSVLQVVTPTFDPAAGTFEEPVELTINCATSGVTIYYAFDEDPTESSILYDPDNKPFFDNNSTINIRAKAFKDGFISSEVAFATYIINIPQAPVISLFGNDWPGDTHPGEDGSAWLDNSGVNAFLFIAVESHDPGYYVEFGQYFDESWSAFPNQVAGVTANAAELTYGAYHEVQARFRLIADDSYAGEPSNIIPVTAPYQLITNLAMTAMTDGSTYYDLLATWDVIDQVSYSFEMSGGPFTGDTGYAYQRFEPGAPPIGNPWELTAWNLISGVPGFKTTIDGTFAELVLPAMTLETGTTDWPGTHPGESGSCWSSSRMLGVNFQNIDGVHVVTPTVDWGSGETNIGASPLPGGDNSLDLISASTPPGTLIELSVVLMNSVDGATIIPDSGALLTTTTPMETPVINYFDIQTDGSSFATYSLQASWPEGGSAPYGDNFVTEIYDANFLSDPFIKNSDAGTVETGDNDDSNNNLAYATWPQINDPVTLIYWVEDYTLDPARPPSIKASYNQSYTAY